MLRRCIFSSTVTNRYRPQTKLRKGNVFTCVILFMGCIPACNGQVGVYPSMQ